MGFLIFNFFFVFSWVVNGGNMREKYMVKWVWSIVDSWDSWVVNGGNERKRERGWQSECEIVQGFEGYM